MVVGVMPDAGSDGFAVASLIARLRLSLAHFNSEEATAEEPFVQTLHFTTAQAKITPKRCILRQHKLR